MLLIALAVVAPPRPVSATDPAAGIPPDGPAGPVRTVHDIKTTAAVGSMVTTNVVSVTGVSCPNCASATTAADFTVKEGADSIRVHVQNTWQARWNVKKQNNVPSAGQAVVVQGRIESSGGVRYIEMKRFAERDHWGPVVKAYDVAAGKYPTGAYVWLSPVKVLNVAKWDDGDRTFDVRDPAGGGLVHIEVAPPFYGQVRVPNMGETIQPYGMVRFDPDHNWWEIHPLRCLNPGECVPLAAGYVLNGAPAGTPDSKGWYTQGGPVPLWVPLNGGGGGTTTGGLSATFTPTAGNDWWVQVKVTADKPLRGVDVSANGGAWTPLDHSSWGDWVKSLYAKGSVKFRATATDGTTATSASFTWPPG